jgi:nucleoside-diphosphate-sugar epimerase
MNSHSVWVTGGTGFLGSRVVRLLTERAIDVHCLVRSKNAAAALVGSLPSEAASRVKFVFGSLNDAEVCHALAASAPVGYHIASSLSGSAAALFSANVVATRTLLQAVRASGCRRFVLVSSMSVYGTYQLPENSLLDEGCALDPMPQQRDPYAFSKIVQEQVCWAARDEWNLPLVVVRPGMIYGPGRDFLTARVGLKVGPLMVRFGGSRKLPYTFVDNCAEAVVLAGIAEGIEGESFNIVDDDLPTGRELIRERRRHGARLPAVTVPLWAVRPMARWYTAYAKYSEGQLPSILTPYRAAAQWNTLRYSNAKAKTRLNWTCRTSLSDGLRLTLESRSAGSR